MHGKQMSSRLRDQDLDLDSKGKRFVCPMQQIKMDAPGLVPGFSHILFCGKTFAPHVLVSVGGNFAVTSANVLGFS